MSKAKKPLGLGKGLSAIFETEDNNVTTAITTSFEIPIKEIKPNKEQPRTVFDQQAIDELSSSIKRLGVIQPITVRAEEDGSYKIISGERRYRASVKAGLEKIPAYVRTADDAELLEMALVENIQREELGAIEIALTLERLIKELNVTQDALSKSVGKRRSTIANYLRLLTLSPAVQDALQNNVISMGHAKVIASVEGVEAQEGLLLEITRGGLSVRAAEQLLSSVKPAKTNAKPKSTSPATEELDSKLLNTIEPLEQIFGKKNVRVQGRSNGGGQISISFASSLELKQIVEKLKN